MGLKVETPDGPEHQPEVLVYSSKWPTFLKWWLVVLWPLVIIVELDRLMLIRLEGQGECKGTGRMEQERSKMACTLLLWISGGRSGDNRHRDTGSPTKPHFSPDQPWAQAFTLSALCLSLGTVGG